MPKPFMIEFKGVTKSVKEWAEEYGQTPERIYKRIVHQHWDAGRAITEPPRRPKKYKYKGKMYTARELAEINGDISDSAMTFRIQRWGGNIEKAVETKNQKPFFKHPELSKGHKKRPEFCTDPDCDKCPYPECVW